MPLGKNEFYSMKLRKKVKIPDNKIRQVTRKGRLFAVGTYDNPKHECWKILGKPKSKKK